MLKSIVLFVILTGFVADAQVSDCHKIEIYLQGTNMPGSVYLAYAEKEAANMLAAAGVQLRWTTAKPDRSPDPCGIPIVVQFAVREPRTSFPRALAYSLPLNTDEGKIVIFWDKL